MHELSESSKRIIDAGNAAFVIVAGATAALTLAQWALITAIVASVLSAAWQVMRFYDRFRYGPSGDRNG